MMILIFQHHVWRFSSGALSFQTHVQNHHVVRNRTRARAPTVDGSTTKYTPSWRAGEAFANCLSMEKIEIPNSVTDPWVGDGRDPLLLPAIGLACGFGRTLQHPRSADVA